MTLLTEKQAFDNAMAAVVTAVDEYTDKLRGGRANTAQIQREIEAELRKVFNRRKLEG